MCVPAVSSFVTAVLLVLVVPVFPPDENVIGEVVRSESECETVESQTVSFSKKARNVFFFFVEKSKRHEYRRNSQEEDSRNRTRR